MNRFKVTYDIVTEESAEYGDTDECGFVTADGDHVNVSDVIHERMPSEDFKMNLRQALDHCYPQEDSGSWFTEVDGRDNYSTGEHETRSLHPPDNITPASYRRLCRLFKLIVQTEVNTWQRC